MANRSAVWFSLPAPDHHLGCGSGSHAAQTAAAMRGFERVLLGGQPGDRPPDLVLGVGVRRDYAAVIPPCRKRSTASPPADPSGPPSLFTPRRPELWDGRAGERIVAGIAEWFAWRQFDGHRACP